MEHLLFRIIFAVSLVLGPSAALAKAPSIQLERIGKWELNYDEDSCHLLARFGEGEQEIILNLTRFQPGDAMELRLYGKSLKAPGQFIPASIDFNSDGISQATTVWMGTAQDLPMAIYGTVRFDDWRADKPGQIGPPISPETEAKITNLLVKAPNGKRLSLHLGTMRATMAAMRRCTSELVSRWGYDPAAMTALSQRPVPTSAPNKWFAPNDYPTKMVRDAENGIVQFRLDIDEAGKVLGCHVLGAAGKAEFIALTCDLIAKRAKFNPALDVNGKPIKAYWVESVRWMIA